MTNNESKNYNSDQAFRQALDQKIKTFARDRDEIVRQIAFERFVARLDPINTAVKGGYALNSFLDKSRTTKDVDLEVLKTGISIALQTQPIHTALAAVIEERTKIDLYDHMTFSILRIEEISGRGEGTGCRLTIETNAGGRFFCSFWVDIVTAEERILPSETVFGHGYLEFAGIAKPIITLMAREQIFAEKLHAYTEPWVGRDNTRVKDMIDLLLLIDQGLDISKSKHAINTVFNKRQTHKLPQQLPEPPASWKNKFKDFTKDLKLPTTMGEAYKLLAAFYDSLIQ